MSVLPGVVLSADRYELLLMHHLLVLILFVQLAAAFWRSNCLMDVQSRKLPIEKGTNMMIGSLAVSGVLNSKRK
jgi:hypothetical protein